MQVLSVIIIFPALSRKNIFSSVAYNVGVSGIYSSVYRFRYFDHAFLNNSERKDIVSLHSY